MEIDLTGIDILVSKLALFILFALVLGFAFGWRSAAPRENK